MLTARYAASPRLTWMLSVPYRSIRSPKDVGGSAQKHIDRSFRGVGDAILLGRYRLRTGDGRESSRLYVLSGLRLPTGQANPNHTWRAADGSPILSRDPVLQPGFGTYDPIVGVQWAETRRGGRSFHLGALYRHTGGTNDYGYRFGNEFQLTAGASLPMGRSLTLSPGLLLQISGHDRDYDPLPGKHRGVVSNTGGRWLYFMPALRYGALQLTAQFPIYRKTNGNILNPDVILTVHTSADLPLTGSARASRWRRAQPGEIAPVGGDFKVISRGEEVDLAANAVRDKITVFEFASRRCGECRGIASELGKLLAERSDVALRQIDITDASAPAAAQHGVASTPAFLVIDRDGTRVTAEPVDLTAVQDWLARGAETDEEVLATEAPAISCGETGDLAAYLEADRVTVIQFFAPGCGACRSIAPGLRTLLARNPAVALRCVDVGAAPPSVIRRYKIERTPTFLVYSAGGECVGRVESPDGERLAKLIRKAQNAARR